MRKRKEKKLKKELEKNISGLSDQSLLTVGYIFISKPTASCSIALWQNILSTISEILMKK